MREKKYLDWLTARRMSKPLNYISLISTIESVFGDIDGHYEKDLCRTLLTIFDYSADDAMSKHEPKDALKKVLKLQKSGNERYKYYKEGAADRRSRINNYVEFRNSERDELMASPAEIDAASPFANFENATDTAHQLKSKSSKKNARYKGNPIGNAQNFVIRTILSNLGAESFSAEDWNETKKYFGECCVYCGSTDSEIVRDHAIPISRNKLGEHRLGNIVPACKSCNNKKGEQDYIEFCGEDSVAVEKIKDYMTSREYYPLIEDDVEKSDSIRIILNKAHEEVRVVAEKYIELINALFFPDN